MVLLVASVAVAQPVDPAFVTGQAVAVPDDAPVILSDRPATTGEYGGRLHANLSRLVGAQARGGVNLSAASDVPAALLDGSRVLVEIRLVETNRPAALLERLDVRVRHALGGGVTEAWVPISALPALARDDSVARVWPAMIVQPLAGSETTQGLAQGQAGPWHAAGLDGNGATVAIIDSFDDTGGQVDDLQDSDDWPDGSQLTLEKIGSGSFGDNGDPHGNAVLEIAFDIAPGADFIAFDVLTIGDWIEAIEQAVDDGADVISASLGAPLNGIGDGSALPGSVAEAVEDAADEGVLYVNSAGNSRQQHWGGVFDASGNPALHDWSGDGQPINFHGAGDGEAFCLIDGAPLRGELFWADWDVTNNNYNLLLLEFDGSSWQEISASNAPQSGIPGQTPQEFINQISASEFSDPCPEGSGIYGWAVERAGALDEPNLQFFSAIGLDERVFNRSLSFPADSPSAISVAALNVADSEQEPYSSQGPILAPGGELPEGDEHPKPDVASFANVDTVSFGPGVFNGTSSAAPHVAGMLALLIQRNPDETRAERLARLQAISNTGSNDLGDAGHEFRHGFGRTRFQLEEALVVTQQPGDSVVGQAIGPVDVELRDDEGLAVISGPTSELDIAIEDDPSGGDAVLSGTTTQILNDGLAGFDDLAIDTTGTDYSLALSSSGPGPVETDSFDVTAGAASQLSFDVQPSDAEAGQAMSPAIVVQVLDAQGNLVTDDNSTDVMLSISTGPGEAELSGAGPLTVSNGEASFDSVSIDVAETGYRLDAADAEGALASDTSESFDISPGEPTGLAFEVQPTDTPFDQAITPAIVVRIVDDQGNPVMEPSATFVELSIATGPGGASLSGGGPVLVDNGQATFENVSIDQVGEGYRLDASDTVGSLESATSNDFAILAGPPDSLAFVVQPADNAAGQPFEPAVSVEVLDAEGNRVIQDDSTQIELLLSGGAGGSPSGAGPISVTNGLAGFDALIVDQPGVDYQLQAVDGAGALTPDDSQLFDIIDDVIFGDRFEDAGP